MVPSPSFYGWLNRSRQGARATIAGTGGPPFFTAITRAARVGVRTGVLRGGGRAEVAAPSVSRALICGIASAEGAGSHIRCRLLGRGLAGRSASAMRVGFVGCVAR